MLISTVIAIDLIASASKRTTYPSSAPYFSAWNAAAMVVLSASRIVKPELVQMITYEASFVGLFCGVFCGAFFSMGRIGAG